MDYVFAALGLLAPVQESYRFPRAIFPGRYIKIDSSPLGTKFSWDKNEVQVFCIAIVDCRLSQYQVRVFDPSSTERRQI